MSNNDFVKNEVFLFLNNKKITTGCYKETCIIHLKMIKKKQDIFSVY